MQPDGALVQDGATPAPRSALDARVVPLHEVTPALRAAWQDLARDAVEPNPFFEPDAVLAAGALLEGGGAAELLVVQDASGVLHLAVPVLRRARFRRVPVPALLAWHHAYSFAGAPLLRPGREHEVWAEALDLGKQTWMESWLVLPRLPLHGPAATPLHEVLAARWTRAAVLDAFGRPVLRRRPEQTYLDGRMSSRHRKALRRQQRRLGEELGGAVEVVDVAAAGDLDAGVRGLLEVEAAGWKGRARTAIADRAGDEAWFRRWLEALHAEGRVQLWALRAAGRAAAWQCNVLAGQTVFHVKVAYDEEVGRWSPGLQLEVAMVEEFHRDLRLRHLDSCVDAGNKVSAQLYPDRDVVATLAVPLRWPSGPPAVQAAAAASRARELLDAVQERVRARRAAAPS